MKDGKVQVDTLLYAMGSDADDVMLSFHLGEDDACDYGKVKDRFDHHFVKKRNVIYERARFNTRCQGKDESVDAFVTALHSLAQYCDYKELHDEMIRDRLVVGLRDAKLSEKLQLDADLTLEIALTKARQSEAVHQQQAFLRGKEDEVPVASVNRGKRRVGGQTGKTAKKGGKTGGKTPGENCPRCGKTPSHARQQCPARDVKRNSCGKIGHYSRVCRSSEGVKEVKSESMDETEFMQSQVAQRTGGKSHFRCVASPSSLKLTRELRQQSSLTLCTRPLGVHPSRSQIAFSAAQATANCRS